MLETNELTAIPDTSLLRSRYNLVQAFYTDITVTLSSKTLNLTQAGTPVYEILQAKRTASVWLKNGGAQLLRLLLADELEENAGKQLTDLQLTNDINVPFPDKNNFPEDMQRTVGLTDIEKWLNDAKAKLPEFNITSAAELDKLERGRLLLLYEDLIQYRELLDGKQEINDVQTREFTRIINDHLIKHNAFPLFRKFLGELSAQSTNGDLVTSLNFHPSITLIASPDENQVPIANRKTLTFDELKAWAKTQEINEI